MVGQLSSSIIAIAWKEALSSMYFRFYFVFQMETKGIETTKNNAGPAASQETQVFKPKSG